MSTYADRLRLAAGDGSPVLLAASDARAVAETLEAVGAFRDNRSKGIVAQMTGALARLDALARGGGGAGPVEEFEARPPGPSARAVIAEELEWYVAQMKHDLGPLPRPYGLTPAIIEILADRIARKLFGS